MNWFRKSSYANAVNRVNKAEPFTACDSTATAKKSATAIAAVAARNRRDTATTKRSRRKAKAASANSDDHFARKSKTTAAHGKVDLTKSLSALEERLIEVVDPEDFFHDPAHVLAYKEEEKFLHIMSEWEIIENTSVLWGDANAGNYFSADFEDELLQMRTQQHNDRVNGGARQWSDDDDSIDDDGDYALRHSDAASTELLVNTDNGDDGVNVLVNNDYGVHDDDNVGHLKRQRRCKRKLYEFFFADNIQTGIALPKRLKQEVHHRPPITTTNTSVSPATSPTPSPTSRKAHLRKRKHKDQPHDTPAGTKKSSTASSDYSLNRERKYYPSESSTSPLQHPAAIATNSQPALLSICNNMVITDCAINRKQLKTEALACSIMGAIGKCPDRDCTPRSSLHDLIDDPAISRRSVESSIAPHRTGGSLVGNGDSCHPTRWSGCDHYDIKQFFRLDDSGNILLNINHIVEFRGYGFAVAHNKRLYRRYRKECAMVDEYYLSVNTGIGCGCMEILKNLLKLLWNLIICHPRNKINPYGGAGPGDTVRAYTLQLAQDHTSTFSQNIENFISCTKESREAAPQVVMRNMRQFMNGMKNYLVKHGEGKFHQEVEASRARLKSDEFLNLDAILETVMHQLVVLPLREHLYGMFVDYYTRSEDIQLLAQNVKYACGRNALDFGIRSAVTPPSSTSLTVISNLLLRLQEAELPLDKLDLFLCVVSTIFDATGCPRGQQLGADDFLPVLVFVVAKCGFVGAEIEAEFMWGLLQPTLLSGESGYYLTALCSAVHVLKSFMASENESGTGSLDWRSSSLPACSSVLRVIIPDECNGSLQTRTLPVRPNTTTREVCRIIAHKARITNPQDYALFKLVDGEETLLSDIECPQDIRLSAKGKHCMLAYKRIDAKIAWPTATHHQSNGF